MLAAIAMFNFYIINAQLKDSTQAVRPQQSLPEGEWVGSNAIRTTEV